MKTKSNIEFQDFSKSVTTEEFLGVFHLTQAINDNFNKAIENGKKTIEDSKDILQKLLKEHGRFGIPYLEAKKLHTALTEVLVEDISSGFKLFLSNYDGIIEFLRRFSPCDTIQKHNIRRFKNFNEKNK